ncbi:MAG: DNA polymerase IV, partial [Oscillospiraceae bacterium]
MERVIFHCDCNSFFASVELLAYPHLRALPVAVCGSTDNRHGIILAKNDAAKKYGVATAETVWQAKRKCPNLTLLPPHHSLYSKYSKIINGIYASYTDKVEPFGIDESWLDMTGSWQLFAQSPTLAADRLRAEIKDKTGLTISVGVSFNKIFAKLGSDY